MDWLWWIGAALLLLVAEVLSLDLVLLMFALGAAGAAVVMALGGPLWAQVLAFAAVSAAGLVLLRPFLLRHWRRRTPLVETNAAALVGRAATVVAPVGASAGRVKLAGEVWSARLAVPGPELTTGTTVVVVRIDGATAAVAPVTMGTAGLPAPTEGTTA